MQRILKASADFRFSAGMDIHVGGEHFVGLARECKSSVIRVVLLACMPLAALALAYARNLHLVTYPTSNAVAPPQHEQLKMQLMLGAYFGIFSRKGLALYDQVR